MEGLLRLEFVEEGGHSQERSSRREAEEEGFRRVVAL